MLYLQTLGVSLGHTYHCCRLPNSEGLFLTHYILILLCKLRGTKKKCRRKLKKEFSSDESVSLEQSGPESESEEFFGEMLQTIENENKDEEELVNIIEGNIKPGVWVQYWLREKENS